MRIEVVTVCFNSERTIARTVESFLAQGYADKSMLVIDGASSDRTLDIVRSYNSPEIRVVSERDGGIYDAMNKGLRLFTGDAVGFLNSDDTFHDARALERIAEGLADADIVYGDIHMVADHDTKRLVRVWTGGKFGRFSFHLGWVPPHPTFYVRRNVAAAVRAFNLDYRIASDYDFMLRAMTGHGFKAAYVPQVLVDYQMGGTSSSGLRNILQGNLECMDSRRRNLGGLPIDAAFFIRPARRLFQQNWFGRRARTG